MKRYKYVFLSNDESTRTELTDNPIGWEDVNFSVIRDLIYFGIFKTVKADFNFVGDGYRFLQTQYLRYGPDADCLLRIYDGNEFFFESKIDFKMYRDERKTGKISIDLIQSGFVQDFQNREDVKINILTDKTLDLGLLNPINSFMATLRGRNIDFYSEFNIDATYDDLTTWSPPDVPYEQFHHLVPFELIKNDNDNVKSAFAIDTNEDPRPVLLQPTSGIYTNLTTVQQNFEVSFDVNPFIIFDGDAKLIPDNGERLFNNIVSYYLGVVPDAGGSMTTILFEQHFEEVVGPFNFSDTVSVTLEEGESLVFACYRQRRNSGGDRVFLDTSQMSDPPASIGASYRTYIIYNGASLTINDSSVFPDTECPVILPHELFERFTEILTGKPNAFYSTLYGRTDLGYAADGEDAYLSVTGGNLLRGESIEDSEMASSFRDAFQSFSAVSNLGILINGETITIEKKDDLINNNIAVNLGEVSDLVLRPAEELLWNSLKAGYGYQEYEETNGNDEVNTTVQYTNSIRSIKNELNLVSVYRGDMRGIERARRAQFLTTGTSDLKSDKDIFFLDLIKVEGVLMTRRLEGISSVSGMISPETAINLRISPSQNLLNWQRYLGIPIFRKQQQEYYFQSKDKNNTLSMTTARGTTTDGEPLLITEPPYFIPEIREFDAPLTGDMLISLLANPLGRIEYTYREEKFFDYVFEVDGEKERSKGNWSVIGAKASPVESVEDVAALSALKYGDGFDDFIKYGNLEDDILLWQ